MTAGVYQSVRPSAGDLLTRYEGEHKNSAKYGFTDDLGVVAKASATPTTGLSAIHRLYRAATSTFVWMPDGPEMRNAISKYGYTDNGSDFYASSTSQPGCTVAATRMSKGANFRFAFTPATISTWKSQGWSVNEVPFYVAAPISLPPPPPVVTQPGSQGSPSGPSGLNPSGSTIPDTNYAIPATSLFVAPGGKDTNSGTKAAPLLSIAKALALAPSGGTVVLRGGVYHQGSMSDSRPVTIQSYPHEQAWLDGSTRVTTWSQSGSTWSTNWSTPSFCGGQYYNQPLQTPGGPCSYNDAWQGATAPHLVPQDPQQVWLDGKPLSQVASISAVTSGTYFYDHSARVMHIGDSPSGHTVELATSPSALILAGANSAVEGVGFRRYAGNEANSVTESALFVSHGPATISHDVFTDNSGYGLGIDDPSPGTVVNHSVVVNNGVEGITSNGNAHGTKAPNNLRVIDNVISGNNARHFDHQCNYACLVGGVKLAHMVGFTLSGNLVSGNDGAGLWCDEGCTNGVITNNRVTGNTKDGIDYEVSDTGIIANNWIEGNVHGIRIASAHTAVYNNTLVKNGTIEIWTYDDARSPEVGGKVDAIGPNTTGVRIGNNYIVATSLGYLVTPGGASDGGSHTTPSQYFSYVDNDAVVSPSATANVMAWQEQVSGSYQMYLVGDAAKLAAAHGLAAHSQWMLAGTPVSIAAAPLPADVATTLGVSTTTVKGVGVFAPAN